MTEAFLAVLWLSLILCGLGFWVALWLTMLKIVVVCIRQMRGENPDD